MKTPLRYAGGKSRAIKIITPYVINEKKIVSPFMGGGSLEVYWASIGKEVVAYDIFDVLESNGVDLCSVLIKTSITSVVKSE